LAVRDLHFSYTRCNILRGVNLQISPGELVALMGRNGSGKTTLLKCIVGLLQPQHGEVMLAGASLVGRETADICRSVGYLPQEPDALLFAETVADELAITLRNHGLHDNPLNPVKPEPNRADVSERLGTDLTKLATPNRSELLDSNPIQPADLLARLGLSDVAASYPRDLSVGQRQRTALGAVTVTVPDLLLLDEPTRGMDYAAKRALVRLLREWQAEGVCVLLVTHDVELVAQAADRVAILDQGVIVTDGPPAEVLTASIESVPQIVPQIVALFPGTGWLTVEDALASLL
jgi:energy-coupling factor transport system ATP-binding protein